MPENANIDEQVNQVTDAIGWLDNHTIWYAAIIVGGLVVLLILYRMLRGRKKAPEQRVTDQGIDVATLGSDPVPSGAAHLEFYHLPVRLAALVLAPAGRLGNLPPPGDLERVFDAIVPGLAQVVATHKPLIRRWSGQLSVKGFAHIVFQKCPLPGDGGKGTPWSTIAGVIEFDGQPLMAGLILRAESSNSHGQQIVDEAHAWLDRIRVKVSSP
jgi:hypothetical protein